MVAMNNCEHQSVVATLVLSVMMAFFRKFVDRGQGSQGRQGVKGDKIYMEDKGDKGDRGDMVDK